MVAIAGIGNGIAQFWWTRSLALAPPSAVVPFNYLSLVWATILSFAYGRCADPGPAHRFCDRCRLGTLHPVARDLAPPPGGPSAPAVVPPRRVANGFADTRRTAACAGNGISNWARLLAVY